MSRLAITGIAVLALLSVAAGAVYAYRQHVRHQLLQEIKDANQQAHDRALAAQKGVDACYLDGGDWDRARGRCVLPNAETVRRD